MYGEVEAEGGDLKEHSLLRPTNPYAATKASAEMMITAYVRSFKLPAVIIRLNNVYGPHQVRLRWPSRSRTANSSQYPESTNPGDFIVIW